MTDELNDLRSALKRRDERQSEVVLVTFDEPKGEGGAFEPGSLLVAVAASGSERLARLADAARRGDVASIERDLDASSDVDTSLVDPTSEEGLEALPAVAELNYGGRLLIGGLHVPPFTLDGLGWWSLGYSGGELRSGEFSAVSYCRVEGDPLEFLLVANPPMFTDFERRLVQAVAADSQADHLLAEPQAYPATAATVVAVWAAEKALDAAYDAAKEQAAEHRRAMAERAAEARAQQHLRQQAERHQYRQAMAIEIPEDVAASLVEGLDPSASVQALIKARRGLLELPDE